MFDEWELPPIAEAKRKAIAPDIECVVYFLGEDFTQYNVMPRNIQAYEESTGEGSQDNHYHHTTSLDAAAQFRDYR